MGNQSARGDPPDDGCGLDIAVSGICSSIGKTLGGMVSASGLRVSYLRARRHIEPGLSLGGIVRARLNTAASLVIRWVV